MNPFALVLRLSKSSLALRRDGERLRTDAASSSCLKRKISNIIVNAERERGAGQGKQKCVPAAHLQVVPDHGV